MKKIILTFFSILTVAAISQEENTWRLGIQIGSQGNHSKYQSGMQDANARFHQNDFGAGSLNIVGRYDFNRRWMATGGLGLSSYGFEYALAENYSLLRKDKQFTSIKSEFGVIEIPVMGYYKFNMNCKNTRWLVGAGIAQYFNAAQTINKSVSQASDGNTVNYLSSASKTNGGLPVFFRWSVAREKMYRKGGILNASLLFNFGFTELAKSTVNYTIDNQNYEHTFTNNGNFIGLRLAYFFKPFHNPWDNSKKAKATSSH